MENKLMTASESEDFDSQDFGDAEDVLSLCNLPIQGYQPDHLSPHSTTSSDPDLFEFFTGFGSDLSRNNSVSFSSGEILDRSDGREANEYRNLDYSLSNSGSSREFRSVRRNRSSSDLWRSKKVNITAITAMSAKSRWRMFMFGPVKFEPEMDVCAIRKRQGNRPPMRIPPMPEEGKMVAVKSGGGRGKSGGGGGGGGEGVLLKPLGCMSHFTTMLAKSFGCISASMV
ncbi:hypothetical protein CsSME_00028358 [Camellia sinensis var. sinensis]